MARSRSNRYRQDLFVAVAACLAVGEAASFVGFDLHHRTSPVVRRWAEARGHHALAAEWPAKGSPEYYSELSRHDRARRGLAGAGDQLLTFGDGNATVQYLGSLYYALVALGTPNATFLVALDTGSDLFWVPCDCKQCAPLPNNGTAEGVPPLREYSPRRSSTSTPVTCESPLCDRPNACGAATNGSCPYGVRYVSANTSSSGVLVQDVLHLTREGPGPGAAAEPLQAPVVFGCGRVQTGAFLDGGGFDGLLGLGMDRVSVPSVLAARGLVASDSFSMCFGDDGVGRINFGDAGSRGQAETPFIPRTTHPTYNVSFTTINVGSESAPVEFAAVMDSGTSLTYLNDPEYTALGTSFNSRIRERRANFSSGSAGRFPFEYCYTLSPDQRELDLPVVSLTAAGGALFPVTDPIIGVSDGASARPIGYCLAVVKNDIPINIVGRKLPSPLFPHYQRCEQ